MVIVEICWLQHGCYYTGGNGHKPMKKKKKKEKKKKAKYL
jgi:hypothetical protein